MLDDILYHLLLVVRLNSYPFFTIRNIHTSPFSNCVSLSFSGLHLLVFFPPLRKLHLICLHSIFFFLPLFRYLDCPSIGKTIYKHKKEFNSGTAVPPLFLIKKKKSHIRNVTFIPVFSAGLKLARATI